MLAQYIYNKLKSAQYKILEDGLYFGETPDCKGVWASEKTLEQCRDTLCEVLEEWLVLKLQDGDKIPDLCASVNTKICISHTFQHA